LLSQDVSILRRNHLNLANGISIRSARQLEFNSVPKLDVLKPSEKTVTMSGNTEIARLTDLSRAKNSPDSAI
jgi:hypothetical protein